MRQLHATYVRGGIIVTSTYYLGGHSQTPVLGPQDHHILK